MADGVGYIGYLDGIGLEGYERRGEEQRLLFAAAVPFGVLRQLRADFETLEDAAESAIELYEDERGRRAAAVWGGRAGASVLCGGAGAAIMAVLIMVSTFGCNNGLVLAGARVYYAMARDRLFFRPASRLNPKGVPAIALYVQAAWSSALCLTGTYGDLLDYVIFAVLIFYALAIGGIFMLRKKNPGAERPVRAPWYPFLQLVYIAAAAFICASLLIYKPKYTWPGLVIVMIGVPVYFLWRRRAE
jgi:amino acid transporter